MEMNQTTADRIDFLCSEGDTLAEQGNYKSAIEKYEEALELVPSPKADWEASLWIYTAIGDSYFLNGNFEKAMNCFYDAMNCPEGIGNPFVNLRLGQCLFENGVKEKARNFLLQAYMLEGEDIFSEDDSKYFKAIDDLIHSDDIKQNDDLNNKIEEKFDSTQTIILDSELENKIDDLFHLSNVEYNKGNLKGVIELKLKAWNLLPHPKEIADYSYLIADSLGRIYLKIHDLENAKKWSDKLYKCDLERQDTGNNDYLAAQVEFELGKFENSFQLFDLANTKSEGRCFVNDKYYNFFKKNKLKTPPSKKGFSPITFIKKTLNKK